MDGKKLLTILSLHYVFDIIITSHLFRYPIYQAGNPQLRVFLPNFFMKLVKPRDPQPPNVVMFHVSTQMTKHDVKNYLEKIYNVPTENIITYNRMGEIVILKIFIFK